MNIAPDFLQIITFRLPCSMHSSAEAHVLSLAKARSEVLFDGRFELF